MSGFQATPKETFCKNYQVANNRISIFTQISQPILKRSRSTKRKPYLRKIVLRCRNSMQCHHIVIQLHIALLVPYYVFRRVQVLETALETYAAIPCYSLKFASSLLAILHFVC